MINSHRVHYARPGAAIYRLAAAQLRLAPESILFVDDKERQTNTQVAEDLGVHVHVSRGIEPLQAVGRWNRPSNGEFSAMSSVVQRRFGFIFWYTFTPAYTSASSVRIRMADGRLFSPVSLLFRPFGLPWPGG